MPVDKLGEGDLRGEKPFSTDKKYKLKKIIFNYDVILRYEPLTIFTPKKVINRAKFDVVVVVTRPLPRDGGLVGDHGAPEAGQLSTAWTKVRRDRELTKSKRR